MQKIAAGLGLHLFIRISYLQCTSFVPLLCRPDIVHAHDWQSGSGGFSETCTLPEASSQSTTWSFGVDQIQPSCGCLLGLYHRFSDLCHRGACQSILGFTSWDSVLSSVSAHAFAVAMPYNFEGATLSPEQFFEG